LILQGETRAKWAPADAEKSGYPFGATAETLALWRFFVVKSPIEFDRALLPTISKINHAATPRHEDSDWSLVSPHLWAVKYQRHPSL